MKTTDFTGLEKSSGRNEQDDQGRNPGDGTLEEQANLLQEQPPQAGGPVKVTGTTV